MGLDMFLWKVKREEIAYWRKANAIHAWFERKLCDSAGMDNCRDYPVSKEDLEELRDVCQKILNTCHLKKGLVSVGEKYNDRTKKFEPIMEEGEIIENSEIAEELLPTQGGFFFGSTAYDKWYLDDLKETVKQIDKILESLDFDKDEVCYSAWW